MTPEDKEKDDEEFGHEADVVDQLLEELGVDEEMRKELVESGRATEDILKVEPAEQVRRRLEIEKSLDQLRGSIAKMEHRLSEINETIDKVERDLIPVIISFMVKLKGDLVTLKTTLVGRCRRRTKTNLQEEFVARVVGPIVEEEFSKVENTLTTGMSTPVLDKIRELSDTVRNSLEGTVEQLSEMKATLDDFTQRTITELEFLAKQLSTKPVAVVPEDVEDKIRTLEGRVRELSRDLELARERIQNREEEIQQLKQELETARSVIDSHERTIASLRQTSGADASVVTELRAEIKSLEAARDVLEARLKEANEEIERQVQKTRDAMAKLAKRDVEVKDLQTRIAQLESEIQDYKERLAEVDRLRTELSVLKSGDVNRELERLKSEYSRLEASENRLKQQNEELRRRVAELEQRLDYYVGVMQQSDKTKAYLMIEDTGRMSVREIARSLGISPAQVTKWIEDFERLGAVKVSDDGYVSMATAQEEAEGEPASDEPPTE